MNNLNKLDSNPLVHTTDVRLHYTTPRLVAFGAIRDLTAGGSGFKGELSAPGRGGHETRHG